MSDSVDPVSSLADDNQEGPREGVGLAISGGGYRAMLFHLGSFLRLFELGLLKQLDRISSVSGGSITSAKIALEWNRLHTRDDFMARIVMPIRTLAGITIDVPSIIKGVLLPGSVAKRISASYRKHLFGAATLQDLPIEPRFVINATNLETGALWRFSRPFMADWKLGLVPDPTVSLADAVTASSTFPPVLSPFVLDVDPGSFTEVPPGVDPRLLEKISLTDGGVYDNLGLETVWKNYRTVLVSDAGGKNAIDPSPPANWAGHAKRVLDIIHEQNANVRTRQVIASYLLPEADPNKRSGTYWGVRTNIANYGLPNALPAPHVRTLALAETPTRLKALPSAHQDRLINWGYAVCDAAIRRHWPPAGAQPPAGFPYPASEV